MHNPPCLEPLGAQVLHIGGIAVSRAVLDILEFGGTTEKEVIQVMYKVAYPLIYSTRTHASPSATAVKIFGADLRPNGIA